LDIVYINKGVIIMNRRDNTYQLPTGIEIWDDGLHLREKLIPQNDSTVGVLGKYGKYHWNSETTTLTLENVDIALDGERGDALLYSVAKTRNINIELVGVNYFNSSNHVLISLGNTSMTFMSKSNGRLILQGEKKTNGIQGIYSETFFESGEIIFDGFSTAMWMNDSHIEFNGAKVTVINSGSGFAAANSTRYIINSGDIHINADKVGLETHSQSLQIHGGNLLVAGGQMVSDGSPTELPKLYKWQIASDVEGQEIIDSGRFPDKVIPFDKEFKFLQMNVEPYYADTTLVLKEEGLYLGDELLPQNDSSMGKLGVNGMYSWNPDTDTLTLENVDFAYNGMESQPVLGVDRNNKPLNVVMSGKNRLASSMQLIFNIGSSTLTFSSENKGELHLVGGGKTYAISAIYSKIEFKSGAVFFDNFSSGIWSNNCNVLVSGGEVVMNSVKSGIASWNLCEYLISDGYIEVNATDTAFAIPRDYLQMTGGIIQATALNRVFANTFHTLPDTYEWEVDTKTKFPLEQKQGHFPKDEFPMADIDIINSARITRD
jgi:hypothetical protein